VIGAAAGALDSTALLLALLMSSVSSSERIANDFWHVEVPATNPREDTALARESDLVIVSSELADLYSSAGAMKPGACAVSFGRYRRMVMLYGPHGAGSQFALSAPPGSLH
jgi:hypothetical protein